MYCALVKMYCVLVKLYCVLVELYCVLVRLYCVLVKLYCVLVELIILHKTRLFEFRRLKVPRDELGGSSDLHLVTLPFWLAAWGLTILLTYSMVQSPF